MKIVLTESQFNRVFLFENDEDIFEDEETDKKAIYLKEKVQWLFYNKYDTIFEPTIDKIKETGYTIDPKALNKNNYKYDTYTDYEYELIYDTAKDLYGWTITNGLDENLEEFKKERLRRIENGECCIPPIKGNSNKPKPWDSAPAEKQLEFLTKSMTIDFKKENEGKSDEQIWREFNGGTVVGRDWYETMYLTAKNQWNIYGAPNKEWGRDFITKEQLEWAKQRDSSSMAARSAFLRKQKEEQDKAVDYAKKNPPFRDGAQYGVSKDYINSRLPKVDTGIKNTAPQITTYYSQFLNYNKNIRDQKNLIPKYCQPQERTYRTLTYAYHFICDNRGVDCDSKKAEENRREVRNAKSSGTKFWCDWGTPQGKKYGLYCRYLPNKGYSKDPMTFCNNKRSGGVWVYDTKAGPWCGCFNIDTTEGMSADELGNVYTSSDIQELGFDELAIKQYQKENKKSFGDKLLGVVEYFGECFTEITCILDIASIVVLAVPIYGTTLSFLADATNAAIYGGKLATAKTDAEKTEAAMGATFSIFGALMGGGKSDIKNLIKYGNTNPKVYEFMDSVVKGIKEQEEKGFFKGLGKLNKEEEITKIYSKYADIHKLGEKDLKIAGEMMSKLKGVPEGLAEKYVKALEELGGIEKGKLLAAMEEEGLKTQIKNANGDILVGFKNFMKTKAGKEALIELGMFGTLEGVMTIPAVAQWLGEKIQKTKKFMYDVFKDGSIKANVIDQGYNWDITKEIFSSDGSAKDNELLGKAWNAGWRPYDEMYKHEFMGKTKKESPYDEDYMLKLINDIDKVKVTKQYDTEKIRKNLEEGKNKSISEARGWIYDRPKYQTSTFKKLLKEKAKKEMGGEISQKDIENPNYQGTKKCLKEFKDMTSEEIKNMFAKMSDEERKKWIEENIRQNKSQ